MTGMLIFIEVRKECKCVMLIATDKFRFIRCWDAKSSREVYRITVGLGGLGGGPELCIWSLLALR